MKKLLLNLVVKHSKNIVLTEQDNMIKMLNSVIDNQMSTIENLQKENTSLSEQIYVSQSMADTNETLNGHFEQLLDDKLKLIEQLKANDSKLQDKLSKLEAELSQRSCLIKSQSNIIEKYKMVLETKRI